jgi:hypothetical protein
MDSCLSLLKVEGWMPLYKMGNISKMVITVVITCIRVYVIEYRKFLDARYKSHEKIRKNGRAQIIFSKGWPNICIS